MATEQVSGTNLNEITDWRVGVAKQWLEKYRILRVVIAGACKASENISISAAR